MALVPEGFTEGLTEIYLLPTGDNQGVQIWGRNLDTGEEVQIAGLYAAGLTRAYAPNLSNIGIADDGADKVLIDP